MKLVRKKFINSVTEVVKNMENNTMATRSVLDKIKRLNYMNDAPPEMKEYLILLFKISSGKYIAVVDE